VTAAAQTNRRSRRARGHSAGGAAMKRISTGFDEETFEQIAAGAEARGIKFAERVRQLVEIGIESEKQEEATSCSTCSTSRLGSSSISSTSKSRSL
jgi:hypothetical protein